MEDRNSHLIALGAGMILGLGGLIVLINCWPLLILGLAIWIISKGLKTKQTIPGE